MKYLILLFLVGCGSAQMVLDSKTNYPMDMDLEINGKKGVGSMVVKKSLHYNIELVAKGDLDLLWYSSCHRSDYQERAWDKGWFKDHDEAKLTYRPGLLERKNCALRILAAEKKKGRHSRALIDFEDSEHTMPARIRCNGHEYTSNGVSICATQRGLRQRIEFGVKILTGKPKKASCPQMLAKDGQVFEYKNPVGECHYFFFEADGDRRHRLTTYGWQEPILRED